MHAFPGIQTLLRLDLDSDPLGMLVDIAKMKTGSKASGAVALRD